MYILSVNAFGLITYFNGPHLGSQQDLGAFRDSNIRPAFEQTFKRFNIPLHEFAKIGDKIFVPRRPCFLALLKNPVPVDQEEFERIESTCRTCVEWVNGKITENWKYITYKSQLKVQLSDVAVHIVVAAILTNAFTLCNGGQTANYFSDSEGNPFGMEIPTLEEWFEII